MIRSMNGIFTTNCAITIPSGVKTTVSPMLESHFPNVVVPNKSKSPTPATSGGNARGMSTMVLTSVFPKK